MKQTMKIFGMMFFAVALLASCDNDNDPADDNLFVGQYQGSVSFSDPDNNTETSTDEGQVTVVKVGNNYTFDFSNDIPSITGITMEKNQNTLISTDGAINIDANSVDILYTIDGKTWTANCTR
ncbi:MAG TPA: hypothetical protein ENH87_13160 [Pricia antarctica]|uniref:Lipocalin-like domain-containing protein n=1 Tax=Pricia antarctica TaxID=641691 RepID=A0A831QR90_9FLAO|nr:hypothetical protein [Pricia antarctica]